MLTSQNFNKDSDIYSVQTNLILDRDQQLNVESQPHRSIL